MTHVLDQSAPDSIATEPKPVPPMEIPMSQIEYLRVKRVTLGHESRYIRKRIRRHQKAGREILSARMQSHLTGLRRAARASHLAHAYLTGRPYRTVEGQDTRSDPPLESIAAELRRFGSGPDREATWKDVLHWTEGGPTLRQEQDTAA